MVYLCSDAMASEKSMYRKCKVKGCTVCRHCLDLTFRCKYKDLRCKKIKLNSIEKVHCIRLWIIKNFLNGMQPVFKFSFVLWGICRSFLIFPVSSKTLFRDLIHPVGTDLYFYPPSLLTHQCHM